MLRKRSRASSKETAEKKAVQRPPISILPDIKPATPISEFDHHAYSDRKASFPLERVAPLVGMSPNFVRKVVGRKPLLDIADVLRLLDQDAFSETYVPRSKIIEHLLSPSDITAEFHLPTFDSGFALKADETLRFLRSMPEKSVQCVVTSTPYWGLRIYKHPVAVKWADGADAVYGHEQTPEAFIRHTAEILKELFRILKTGGSIWWNVMDSFNTRTQIRGSAVEALRAMQGKDKRTWSQHACRRYSAGHAYLKDGEQCLIPSRIAEKAERLGFYVKSVITWAKTSSLPEPQESRVSRNLEYILHFSKVRSPLFHKEAYRKLPASVGGRNNGSETDKLSDVWTLPTSSGRDGHGAQFPVALPGRCIALSTNKNDIVLDPFVGAGNSGIAATALGRRFIGVDVSSEYLEIARRKLLATQKELIKLPLEKVADSVAAIDDPKSKK
jgi:DNA modification methylase